MAEYVKTGKYSFERVIIALHFGEKYTSLFLLISEEACWTRYTRIILDRRSLYYYSPDGAAGTERCYGE